MLFVIKNGISELRILIIFLEALLLLFFLNILTLGQFRIVADNIEQVTSLILEQIFMLNVLFINSLILDLLGIHENAIRGEVKALWLDIHGFHSSRNNLPFILLQYFYLLLFNENLSDTPSHARFY